ncbi:MmcQ/YjbR family DNA-binding protein [Paenibacillus sp. OAS669]|uniref:MmcQ/YjbR family DNA-binding protein n=1 Tax=Paenibacillus sp. OAS669 TaxID=2663821 RepID=UPI001789046A|nr:MmcQ/YjbR family DNA-binding protein [Paenibacillus sp. OAS669]MBE1443395.1 hypothetical protein [Paenibacillus sp. OAS669]
MTFHKPIASKEGLKLVERIRRFCQAFPEVTEKIDQFGHTSFRVSDKPFVMLGEGEAVSMSIKADRDTQEFLLQLEDTNYAKTRYIGHHGWVTIIDLARADWKEIEELIAEAYVRTAPKKYAKWLQQTENR